MMRTRRAGGVDAATWRTGGSADAWQRAVDWAVRTCENHRVVYLDTETTGLGPNDEIIDIAIVAADGGTVLDTLVRPLRPIPPMATAIHGLTDEVVASAPTWDAVYPLLHDIVTDRVVVVYNAEFDRRLIGQCCTRRNLAVPAADWQCAMRAFAEFYGEPGRGGYRWHPLERAARTFGAAAGGHRALADAHACRAVVKGMASMVGGRTRL